MFEKLKHLQKHEENSEHVEREFMPRKLDSPANYEESNLSKEFEHEKAPKEQFDLDDEDMSAAKIDEEDMMMRKAEENFKAK